MEKHANIQHCVVVIGALREDFFSSVQKLKR